MVENTEKDLFWGGKTSGKTQPIDRNRSVSIVELSKSVYHH